MSLVDRRLLGLSSAEGPSSELVVGLNVNANCIMSIRTERPEEKKKCTCSAERPAVSTVSMAAFHFTWKQTAPGLTLPNSLSLTPFLCLVCFPLQRDISVRRWRAQIVIYRGCDQRGGAPPPPFSLRVRAYSTWECVLS